MNPPSQSGSSSAGRGEAARPAPRGRFVPTRWSVVLQAGQADGTGGRDALAGLCRTYWYPLYAHVRRRGFAPPDAEDLTQEFFARLLAGPTLARADPARGRFRSFLLATLDHFLADERDRARAQKRGGGLELVSIDAATAEQRLGLEAADDRSPDRAFDRRWALAVLDTVLGRLEEEYRREGKAAGFAVLKTTLTGAREGQPYAELAAQLGTTEGAVKVAVHRLRKRYRALLETEIADTVTSPGAAEEEMRHLLAAVRT